MKLLFLTSYYKPETAASSYLGENIREALCENDITIELFTPLPTRGISDNVRNQFIERKIEVEFDGKLRVHRFDLMREGKNPLIRAFRYFYCCLKQYYYGVFAKDAKACNVIFAASTPPIQGAMAAFVKKSSNKPFVYNLQDIFPDSLAGTSLAKKGGLLWKIGRVIENFTYKHADKIIVISEDFKKNIMAKGVPESKIEVVYNWVDQNAVVDIPRNQNKLFDAYNLDRSKFYIEYSGNIGLTQNMDLLLEVMKEFKVTGERLKVKKEDEGLNEEEKIELVMCESICLVLVGEGAYKNQVEEIVKRDELTNVVMIPFQPYEDISYVFSLGDAGLVISKPGVGANSVPSKTWSIMSASRPVLANFDENELKDILEGQRSKVEGQMKPCGIFTKAGDKEAFKQSIITLYKNRDLCKQYGENGRRFVMANLTKEVGTAKYVQVIKDVVANSKKK